MKLRNTARIAVAAGLCLSMMLGSAPTAAFAATEADAPETKDVATMSWGKPKTSYEFTFETADGTFVGAGSDEFWNDKQAERAISEYLPEGYAVVSSDISWDFHCLYKQVKVIVQKKVDSTSGDGSDADNMGVTGSTSGDGSAEDNNGVTGSTSGDGSAEDNNGVTGSTSGDGSDADNMGVTGSTSGDGSAEDNNGVTGSTSGDGSDADDMGVTGSTSGDGSEQDNIGVDGKDEGTTKPETKPEDQKKDEAKKDDKALPQTGDSSAAVVAGVAVAGVAVAAAGVSLKRRQNN